MSCNREPSARREGVLRGRAALRREQQRSAPPPKPTSLGTFLFGDKKVPRRRQHAWIFLQHLTKCVDPSTRKLARDDIIFPPFIKDQHSQKFFHNLWGLWKDNLWKTFPKIFFPSPCGKPGISPQGAVEKNPLPL